jgi:NAD(P)-dependent dehydrogenase (short-subunit alcohol dehydrogenase family)
MSPAQPEPGKRLTGRRVLITGGASGIGAATAALFVREGATVVVADRDAEKLRRSVAESGAMAIPFDVSDPVGVRDGVSAAASAMGGIDGLVNCAGISISAAFEDTTLEVWRRAMDVNLTGVYLVCHNALPHLKRAHRASIVNVASGVAHQPLLNRSAYAASKAGLLAFTKVLALELAPRIRCNVISPGAVETPMVTDMFTERAQIDLISSRYALKRLGEPSELAYAILYLIGPESSFVTGSTLVVDGGRAFF